MLYKYMAKGWYYAIHSTKFFRIIFHVYSVSHVNSGFDDYKKMPHECH